MNNDCIYNIFIKLNVNDIINCALVCKRFYNISKTEMLWYLLFKENFYNGLGGFTNPPRPLNLSD